MLPIEIRADAYALMFSLRRCHAFRHAAAAAPRLPLPPPLCATLMPLFFRILRCYAMLIRDMLMPAAC